MRSTLELRIDEMMCSSLRSLGHAGFYVGSFKEAPPVAVRPPREYTSSSVEEIHHSSKVQSSKTFSHLQRKVSLRRL